MKRLDWYIIGKFLGTFFLSIVLILCIAVVFDLTEKLDNFYEPGSFARDSFRLLHEFLAVLAGYVQPIVHLYIGNLLYLKDGKQQRDHIYPGRRCQLRALPATLPAYCYFPHCFYLWFRWMGYPAVIKEDACLYG